MHPNFLVISSLLIILASPPASALIPHHGVRTTPQGQRWQFRLSESATDTTMAAYDKAMSRAVATTPFSPASKGASSAPTNSGRVHALTSLDDYLNLVDAAPPDSLVVVKYYGKFCPLCKRVAQKYKKMARYYSSAPIQFAEIEKSIDPQLFDTMEVTTFPYLQIFRNGQCIASHGTESASRFETVVNDTIQNFLRMEDENHWESFLKAFEGPISRATNNLHTMRFNAKQ